MLAVALAKNARAWTVAPWLHLTRHRQYVSPAECKWPANWNKQSFVWPRPENLRSCCIAVAWCVKSNAIQARLPGPVDHQHVALNPCFLRTSPHLPIPRTTTCPAWPRNKELINKTVASTIYGASFCSFSARSTSGIRRIFFADIAPAASDE